MKLFKKILLVLVLLVAIVVYTQYPKLNIISGYASKNMASTVFLTGRTPASVTVNDNNVPLIKLASVDVEDARAKASVFGLMNREAVCFDGIGCMLINEEFDENFKITVPRRRKKANRMPFPYGDGPPKDTIYNNVDYGLLDYALDKAFENPDVQKTRTVLVAYKNQIVAERYTKGFDHQTPVLGWSMTKSVMATLYGILEYEGKIDLDLPAPISAWQSDERKNITLNHLLRMQSGLEWEEDYTSISDVTKMLFLDTDMTVGQAKKKTLAPPTEIWNYSSGTSNLLSGILRQQFKSHQEYMDFPYASLIDKIGMNSMIIETDQAGNYVGSSYAWANTRDWAKFGLLYLNNGNWNGEQLFDESWIEYITRPTEHSNGTYGAHFWLNVENKFPDAPTDMYSANGYQGQRVFIIPSKDLVIVRTGLAESPDFDFNYFLKNVLAAFE